MIARLSAMLGCASFAMFALSANAADIYRWVDENGQTHVSDTVPPKYKKSATKVDTSASKVSESQRAEAAARVAREKAALEKSAPPAAQSTGESAPVRKPGTSSPGGRSATCDELRRAYAESQSCFNSYRTANGGVKVEAYQNCPEVPDPSTTCGIPSN